jgi:hypothetical protein
VNYIRCTGKDCPENKQSGFLFEPKKKCEGCVSALVKNSSGRWVSYTGGAEK